MPTPTDKNVRRVTSVGGRIDEPVTETATNETRTETTAPTVATETTAPETTTSTEAAKPTTTSIGLSSGGFGGAGRAQPAAVGAPATTSPNSGATVQLADTPEA